MAWGSGRETVAAGPPGVPGLWGLVFYRLAKGLGKLVGTRCGAAVATDMLDERNDFFGLLALDKGGDALQVAVASAYEVAGRDDVVVVEFHMYQARTGA